MAVAVVAGLATLGGAALAGAVTSFAVGLGYFALGAGMSVISRALAPKLDLGAQIRGTTTTVREPAQSRKVVYGETRVGGNVVFIHHAGEDNKYLYLVVVFATHEIESYEEIWFNDNKIWESGSFVGSWQNYVTIDRKYGTATQAASTTLRDDVAAWTNAHKLSGIAYISFRLTWDQDKFPGGVPNITSVIKGKKVYDPRLDSTVSYGSGSHRVDDSSTWEYSTNPALCVRDYLTNGASGYPNIDDIAFGLGEDPSLINLASLKEAADYCDDTQQGSPLADIYSTGAKRFECSGRLETSNQIKSNIEQLLSAMGGRLTYSGGEYFIQAAQYRAPTITIDESVIISAVETRTKQSRRTLYNGVKGTFISKEKNFKVLDYVSQISSTYALEDGDPIFLDMPLPFVTKQLQAQALAKIALLKSRQQIVISMTVNLAGLKLKIGDTVYIDNDKLGYDNKIFEVTGYELALGNNGEMGVRLECIETAEDVYDWTTSDEQDFLSGGELDLYDGRTVDNVTNLSKTEFALVGPDGTSTTTVELTWTAPTDAFIDFYKIRYNINGTTNYFHAETKETRILLTGLDVSSTYDFRVQVQNLLGVTSSGTTLTGEVFQGDQTAPSVPTNTSATGGIQTITAEWENNSDDIDYAYTLVFVETSNTQPANYSNPTAKVAGEEYVLTGLSGAVTRWFFLANVDFTGNVSGFTSGFSGTSVVADVDDVDTGSLDNALGSEFPINGLAHYWPCNSVQGDILVDVVGGVNATQVTAGGATISTDSPTGKSFTNGASNGFTLLNDTQADAIQTSDGFAWSIWFKSESTTGPSAGRIITRDFSDNWGVRIYQDESPNQTIRFFGEPDEENVTPTVAQGEWHHVCIVEDGNGEMFGYINGEKVTSALEYTPTTAARPVVIGCATEDAATGGNAFKGKLTEVRAFNRALTDVEVRALYRMPSGSMPQQVDGGLIVDSTISDDQVLSLDGGITTITNLQVANLSGDVSEVFSLAIFKYPYHNVTLSPTTVGEFSIPAPDASIFKYASLNGKIKYVPSTNIDNCILDVEFQKKSRGVTTATTLGAVLSAGFTGSPYTHYAEVSGDHSKEIDVYGSISNSATNVNTSGGPKAIEYIPSTNRTKIIYSGSQSTTPSFTTSDTLYYHPDGRTSSGTWLGDAAGAQRYGIPNLGISTSITLPLNQPLAKSNAQEDYRVRVNTANLQTGSVQISTIEAQIFLMT